MKYIINTSQIKSAVYKFLDNLVEDAEVKKLKPDTGFTWVEYKIEIVNNGRKLFFVNIAPKNYYRDIDNTLIYDLKIAYDMKKLFPIRLNLISEMVGQWFEDKYLASEDRNIDDVNTIRFEENDYDDDEDF
jgi:hypothetical protein